MTSEDNPTEKNMNNEEQGEYQEQMEQEEIQGAEQSDAIPELSDKELRALAMNCMEGKAFGTWMCANPDEMRASFPILGLVDQAWMDGMKARNVVHFWESMDKAAPIAVNGKPMFFSCQAITESSHERLSVFINTLIEQRKAFLGDDA